MQTVSNLNLGPWDTGPAFEGTNAIAQTHCPKFLNKVIVCFFISDLLYSLKNLAGIIFGVVKWPITSYKGENFHEFRGFVAIFESFLHKIGGCNIFWWQHQQPIRESFLP